MSENLNEKENAGKTAAPSRKSSGRRNWIRLVCMVLAALLPAALAAAALVALPKAYEETFLGELQDKYARLNETDEPKIVVIGGSSVAFGLDSAALEKATGYKVVNFGLYATLGTKIMLDLSVKGINRGDIVVLAPELDNQTLSLYFNATSAWQGLEGDLSMLFRTGRDNWGDLLAQLPDYLSKRVHYATSGEKLSPSGVYRHDSFNEYGDICYPRPYNVMKFQYDRTQTIRLVPEIFDADFLKYLNDYIDRVTHRGAAVYFSYCPMNEAALSKDTTDASVADFNSFIAENVGCEIITDPNSSIMDKGYFYDTNYHLNDAGVTVHTAYLAADILRALGRTDAVIGELPDPPGRQPASTGSQTAQADPWEKYFTYSDLGEGVQITGVTEEAAYLTALTLPESAAGRPVLSLGAGVFSSCRALQEITVGQTLSSIDDGAFSDCPTLLIIHMRREEADTLACSEKLFDGTPDALEIHLYTETSFANFTTGYRWGVFASRMMLVCE